MTVNIKAPGLEGQTFEARLIIGGVQQPTVTIPNYGMVPDTVEMTALGARVNVLQDDVTSPTAGRAAPRPDGKTTLNLLDVFAAQDVTADLPGGSQALIHVTAAAQKRGHPSGEGYWLPVDGNNRFVCEPGQRHRKWHWGKSASAMTKAQIAAAAGVTEATVTGDWLLARPQYGGTPQTAIHADLFSLVGSTIKADNVAGRSDHHLLERGQDFTSFSWGGFCGEDEIHPMRIGAWGVGADPVIRLVNNFLASPYCVFQDVATNREKMNQWYTFCQAYDHVDIGLAMELSNNWMVTVRETTILKAWYDAPKQISSDGKWVANGNHLPGIYASTEGIVVDSCVIDHSGWADGYDYNGDATKPMPTSMFSHAIYFSEWTLDVTIRNNLLSRAASCGVQLRAGVHLEGNLLVDNNLQAAVNSFAGNKQFNNVLDNVAFSAGYKRVAYSEGGYNWGYDVNGPLSAMKGNIVAHKANPDDAAEIAAKPDNWDAVTGVSNSVKLVNDTQSWRFSSQNLNVDGLDPAVLNQTTIQRFAGMKAGTTFRTIPEFVADTAAAPDIGPIVREGVRWTKSRFGRPIPQRTAPADLTFVPDPDFDGFRWDNRYNWSTKDLPGTNAADRVDLSGNFVRFGLTNASIAAMESNGAFLDASSGKLTVGTLLDAFDLQIRQSGQVWIGTAAQPLAVNAISGRLALTGEVANLDLRAGGQTQVLLGPDCTVPAGRSLVLSGQRARVGWDGTGTATLDIAGTLEFRRGVRVSVDPASMVPIRYVYKHIGNMVTGSISGFTARVSAVERTTVRGTRYNIWLDDVTGTPVVGDVITVAPKRNGDGTDDPTTLTLTAVGTFGIVPLQRFRSGAVGDGLAEPTVTATLTLAPTARIVVPAGLPAGSHDLTGPGVTVVNNGASLPAGVTVTGGKLVLVVT